MKKEYKKPEFAYLGSGSSIIAGYQGQQNEGASSTCKNCAGAEKS